MDAGHSLREVGMRPASLIATLFLCLVAIAHLIRLALTVTVTVDGMAIPLWASLPAALFTGVLAFFLWRESRAAPTATPR